MIMAFIMVMAIPMIMGIRTIPKKTKLAVIEVTSSFDYIKDPDEIYRRSFATVRSEADLSAFNALEADVVVRLIHACGMIDIAEDVRISNGAAVAGVEALSRGANILVDVEMVGSGIIQSRLKNGNSVLCTLNNQSVPEMAKVLGTTRSAAAIDLWDDKLDGSIAVFGNAPTALFHLFERIEAGGPKPALILGFPVGFIGAAESKQALTEYSHDVPYMTLLGRRGGSAIAAAAVNAIAGNVT
jgi:precorrin-8X/cobalt-precorrin-8 methylmutase